MKERNKKERKWEDNRRTESRLKSRTVKERMKK